MRVDPSPVRGEEVVDIVVPTCSVVVLVLADGGGGEGVVVVVFGRCQVVRLVLWSM